MKGKCWIITTGYILLCVVLLILACKHEPGPFSEATARILLVERNKCDCGYNIFLNGYTPKMWYTSKTIIKIDSSIEESKALFYLSTDGLLAHNKPITLIFKNKEEVASLGSSVKAILNNSDGNVVVQTENSNNTCFISITLAEW